MPPVRGERSFRQCYSQPLATENVGVRQTLMNQVQRQGFPNLYQKDPSRDAFVIQLFHVHKSYPGGPDVFRDVNVQFQRGDFVFLMGIAGAGKTTFIRMLLGLEAVTRGYIVIEGRNLQRLPPREIPLLRRCMGVVFQDARLLLSRSVADNVALPLRVAGRSSSFIRKKVARALRFTGLEKKARAPCYHLCGEEQQLAAIARALINDPAVLLADDLTGNLDEEASSRIMELLKDVPKGGTTVIFATHDHRLPAQVRFARFMEIHAYGIEDLSRSREDPPDH